MVVLGLGSNQGNRVQYLRKAIQLLKSESIAPGIQVQKISPIYESDALLPEGAPERWNQSFLNLALLCQTELNPIELLSLIKKIEKQMGRNRLERWAPREIDIDILAMDRIEVSTPELTLPHKGLRERPFALLPFADIAPELLNRFNSPHSVPISKWISQWRSSQADQVPFRTRRSQHFITEIVGILNVTPDSFSDGGLYFNPTNALEQAVLLHSEGAERIDIGAESTRPHAENLNPLDEWTRLERVLRSWPSSLPFSIDTRHSEVALKSIQSGAGWINDVCGFSDPEMRKSVASSSVDLVMMHSLSIPPRQSAVLPDTEDPVALLQEWAELRIRELIESGISKDRVIFDPGLGFGKTPEQSWQILREIDRFHSMGVRILIGHSRKSLLRLLNDRLPHDRDFETAMLSTHLAERGVDYLRVHHPQINQRALKEWAFLNGVVQCQH